MLGGTKYLGLVALALAGCASAPARQADLSTPITPGDARVVVYRTDGPYETLAWIPIIANGNEIGAAGPESVFYRDVPPGSYQIDTSARTTWPGEERAARLAAGETLYIRLAVAREANPENYSAGSTGTVAVPEVVSPNVARAEIGQLSRTASLL